MKIKHTFTIILSALFATAVNAQSKYEIQSPDKTITAQVWIQNKQAFYSISRNAVKVLDNSSLGILREDEDFFSDLALNSVSKNESLSDTYTLKNAKRLINNYRVCNQTNS